MIRDGSHVTLHYVLKVEGREIDNSRPGGPLEYTHGRREILPALEQELEGLEEGERKHVAVPPDDAFGHPDPAAVRSVSRAAFGNVEAVNAGEIVHGRVGTEEFHATVVSVDDEHVLLDMNHPLAGKTLEYDVEVVKVE